MKKKRIILLLLALIMVLTVSGCGEKENAEATPVMGFYDAVKNNDMESIDSFIYYENPDEVVKETDIDLSELGFGDLDDEEVTKLMYSELKYEINDIERDGDRATVNTTVTSKDFSELMGELFKEIMSMEDLFFLDEDEIDERASKKFIDVLRNTDKTKDTTLDIKVVKKDGKWLIDGEDPQNVFRLVMALAPGIDSLATFGEEALLEYLEELEELDDFDFEDESNIDVDSIVHEIPKDKEVYKEGVYKIGDKMPAGEYKLFSTDDFSSFKVSKSSDGDYEDTLSSEIFTNNYYIKVEEGNYLELEGAFAIKAKDAEPHKGKKGVGMYKVGFDIEPGEYEVVFKGDKDWSGYFEVIDGIDGEITNNKIFTNNAIFKVKKGDYLVIGEFCEIVE